MVAGHGRSGGRSSHEPADHRIECSLFRLSVRDQVTLEEAYRPGELTRCVSRMRTAGRLQEDIEFWHQLLMLVT
jgi:hypothetical protein